MGNICSRICDVILLEVGRYNGDRVHCSSPVPDEVMRVCPSLIKKSEVESAIIPVLPFGDDKERSSTHSHDFPNSGCNSPSSPFHTMSWGADRRDLKHMFMQSNEELNRQREDA